MLLYQLKPEQIPTAEKLHLRNKTHSIDNFKLSTEKLKPEIG